MAARAALDAFRRDGVIPCPNGLKYLSYQTEAVRFGLECWVRGTGVLLGDEMGLGKSIETIGLINADKSISKVLITCPNTLKITWCRELAKWFVRPLRVAVQYAAEPWVGAAAGGVIINYDIVHRFEKELKSKLWSLRVLDEAHYVKNPRARRTTFTLSISAQRKVALTGTPIENRPVELFPILHDLDPVRWPNFHAFAHRSCDARHNRYGWDYSGHSNEAELNQILRSTVLVRRLKRDVLSELPSKRHQIIELDSSGLETMLAAQRRQQGLQEKRLEELRQQVRNPRVAESPGEYKAAVKALRAGQGALFEEMARIRHETALAKLPQIIAFAKDALENGKIILFGHHLDVVAGLKEAFPEAAVVTGETDAKSRQAEVDRFQNDPACDVFIGNDAAGEGLTLTAASHVIFAEADWVPAKLAQKADRAHRIGQHGSVLCSYLVLAGSLDAEMMRSVVAKMEVIDAVLDKAYTAR
jgi:SWI/SNF-related matrix-associated actin-dependent regulator of chromatin subfamily A-like protein 1